MRWEAVGRASVFSPIRRVPLALMVADALGLYLTATDMRTGLPRVFTQPEISIKSFLGSAAIPSRRDWDGHLLGQGYVGNAVLLPVLRGQEDGDILLIQTNQFRHNAVPTTARDLRGPFPK